MKGNARDLARWLHVPLPRDKPAIRVFAFPYAGATGWVFHAWAKGLPSDVELCCIQLPGRLARIAEQPYVRIAPLVDALAEVISQLTDVPFVFYGHSMGATVAFELTHLLRKRAVDCPAHLIVSGRSAPQLRGLTGEIHRLPDRQFIEEIKRFDGIPQQILDDADFLKLLIPAMRADFELISNLDYSERDRLDIPITAMGGSRDHDVPEDHIRAWSTQSSAGFEACFFDGGHFFINEFRAEVVDKISCICAGVTINHRQDLCE